MKKLRYTLSLLTALSIVSCDAAAPPAAPATTPTAATTEAKGFFYLLDASGRHLRSGHLPHNHQDHKWMLEMQDETTNAEILHIWLDEDFVTVDL